MNCPNCGNILIDDFDEYDQTQICLICGRRYVEFEGRLELYTDWAVKLEFAPWSEKRKVRCHLE